MTKPDDLTEAMRMLEAVPDEWTLVECLTARDRFHMIALKDRALVERKIRKGSDGRHQWQTRRTPAGRSILAKGLGK